MSAPSAGPTLEVRGASKAYRSGEGTVTALCEGNLELVPGRVTGIVGPSGSGKTTLLMIAGLLERPTGGAVYFGGRMVSSPGSRLDDLREFRRTHLGFVFQKANLIPFLNAAENVALSLQLNGAVRTRANARAGALLKGLGLEHRAGNLPSQLSGGEQQRVSIARALANDPRVILADEPTAALDGRRAEQVMRLFRRLADRRKVAVCVVTHDVRWIDFFDSVVELEDGRQRTREAGPVVRR